MDTQCTTEKRNEYETASSLLYESLENSLPIGAETAQDMRGTMMLKKFVNNYEVAFAT